MSLVPHSPCLLVGRSLLEVPQPLGQVGRLAEKGMSASHGLLCLGVRALRKQLPDVFILVQLLDGDRLRSW
jgi:hypothetical protein